MCLPNFIEFKQIDETNSLIGYRTWKNPVNKFILKSEYQDYTWKKIEGPHEIKLNNSGIYAYNYYYYKHYNHYNHYYNNNNYNDYNDNDYNYYYNYNDYYLQGIIKQWGKVAVHKNGNRSEFAIIHKLFTIRRSDAQGTKEFLNWIVKFNEHVELIAKEYNVTTIHWQDFISLKWRISWKT